MAKRPSKPNPRDGLSVGTTPKERHRQKRDAVYQWLVDWKYSTAPWLAVAAGVGPKSTRFVYDLEKQNRLRKVDTTAIPGTLFMLTSQGKAEAMEVNEHAHRINIDASKLNHSLIKHGLAIQQVVLGELDERTTYTPEGRITPVGLEGEKIPDALLHRDAGRGVKPATAALEVELTLKPPERIYRGYAGYLRTFRDQAYSNVVYLFKRTSTRDHYRRLFDAERWPIHERITTSGGRTQWVHAKNEHGELKWFYPEEHPEYTRRFHFRMIGDEVPFEPPRSGGSSGVSARSRHQPRQEVPRVALPYARRWLRCLDDNAYYGWVKDKGEYIHLVSALGHPFKVARKRWCPCNYEDATREAVMFLGLWRARNDIASFATH